MILRKILEATVRVGDRSTKLREGVVYTMGRAGANEIIVDLPSASARHAQIKLEQGRLWVRDLGSRSGTIVNETRLEPQKWTAIRTTDRVYLSQQELAFDLVMEPPPSNVTTSLEKDTARSTADLSSRRTNVLRAAPTLVNTVGRPAPGRKERAPQPISPQTCLTVLGILVVFLLLIVGWSSSTLKRKPLPPPTPTQRQSE